MKGSIATAKITHCRLDQRLRKSFLKGFPGEHPGPESREGKGGGVSPGKDTRTRSSRNTAKGKEAMRQIGF